MDKYDIIIIGSGLGGLSAGAFLSRKGKKVLVLEKHYLIGGYSTNFKRKGYDFDVALHQIGGVEKTGFKKILEISGIYEKLNFIKHKYLYESFYPDFEIKVENGNVKKFKGDLIKLFPDEHFGIRLWFFIMQYLGLQLKIWDFGGRNKIFFPLIMFLAPILIPFLIFFEKIKISTILNICTKNEKLQKTFMELIGYYGDNLDISALYYLVPSYGYYFDGGYYVKGGGQAVSDAFVSVINEGGGKVISKSEVNEIIIDKDLAVGVIVGDKSYYGDFIISNASPFILYEKLLSKWEGSKKELEILNKFEIGPSLTAVYIGVNASIEILNPNFKDSYIVSKNKSYNIDFNNNDIIVFTITNNNDNTLIKSGTTILTLALYEKYSSRDNLTQEEYKLKKDEKKIEVIENLKEFFPEIEKYIDVFEIGTPKTMERYTGNKNGAVYGFSQKIIQSGSNKYGFKTPINNLFLSSSWSFGGGFEGAIRAGYEISKKIK